ncbi:alpha/beta fold hydrolase [Microtetraspora malaysiensis]|uniref:alpha/beta fold hydrolase n=1 Tax=Microtetraspora malaysiensis TaxID=161358 RepID=UPI003D90FDF3
MAAIVTVLIGGPRTAYAAERAAGTEERPCPVAVPTGTTCGYLLVPERRDVPGSRTIRVGYAVHRSTSPQRRPDPVAYSSGGPGSPSLRLVGFLTQMFPDRDVVVIEQRGSRYSEPSLACPEVVGGLVETLKTPKATADEIDPIAKGALACQSRYQAEGIDLRGYRTEEIASDVADLRAALGYEQWNLMGVSYSTRSMAEAAARDPRGTRALVLDSFLPAQVNWYDAAAADLRATLAKLGAAGRFDEMLARYNAAPAAYQTTDPLTRKRIDVRLTGDDIATILGEAMRETEFLPLVPALVDALADGRKELLGPVVDAAGDALTSHDWGLYYAVQCQDEAPFNTFAAAAGPRLFTGVADAAVCTAWHLPRSSDEPGAVEAPTLVLGGQYDPTTPPESARAAANDIPSARFAEFAGVGHGVFLASECGRRTISGFLDAPASGSATAAGSAGAVCDPGAGASAPVRPGDLHLTAAPYRISQSPALIAPLAVFVLVAAAQLVAGLVALVRRRGGGAVRALAGLTGLAFAGLTALSVTGVPNDIVFAIGLPPAIAWYGLLVAASTVLSITAAFRLRAASADIVPVMTGLVFVTWMYGWALA